MFKFDTTFAYHRLSHSGKGTRELDSGGACRVVGTTISLTQSREHNPACGGSDEDSAVRSRGSRCSKLAPSVASSPVCAGTDSLVYLATPPCDSTRTAARPS